MVKNSAFIPSDFLLFAASCMSKWHAVGVQAWIKDLDARLGDGPGVIFLRTHARSGAALSRNDFPLLMDREDIVFLDDTHFSPNPGRLIAAMNVAVRAIFTQNLSKKRPTNPDRRFYFASPQRIDWAALGTLAYGRKFSSRLIDFTLLDEGIGSYIPAKLWQSVRANDRQKDGGYLLGTLIRSAMAESRVYTESVIELLINTERRFAFKVDESSGQIHPNPGIVRSYRNILDQQEGSTQFGADINSPIQLVITQPWVEMGELSWNQVELQLRRVIGSGKERSYVTLLKPHPREDIAKYASLQRHFDPTEFQLSKFSGAAEALFSRLNPNTDAVIGYNSTALIAAQVFYGIRAYSMGYEVINNGSCVGRIFREHFEVFARMTRELVTDYESLISKYNSVR